MNKDALIATLIVLLLLLAIIVVIAAISFVFWNIVRQPIKMKDDILKERDEAKKEITQIQAAKGVEWDQYKSLTEEVDKLRKAYFKTKDDHDSLKEDIAKLQIQKDKLVAINRELNKEAKQEEEKS